MSLRFFSVTRRFGAQRALDGVSLHVREGDAYGLIGHNGAGKTTLLRVALGLMRADEGRVEVDGIDARREPRGARARVGGLVEVPGFHGHLDGRANLVLLARLQGLAPSEARGEAARLLPLVGLSEAGTKPVQAYSQGMRQRLGIAQALLGRPRLVLLDEPTNGLDPEGSAEVRALLARLVREEGVSVLVSSHQLHELAELCNRVGILRRGRLVIDAETSALFAALPGRFEVATDDDARAERTLAALGVRSTRLAAGGLALELDGRSSGEVARRLVDEGLELARLGRRPPSLEEVYLRIADGRFSAGTAELQPGSETAAVETRRRDGPGGDGEEEEEARLEPGGPRGGVGRVFRYEWARSLSRWRTLGLAALPAAVAGLSIALDEHRGAQDAARVAAGELATATAITGFGSTAAALQTGLPLLALVVAGLASQMLAGELARGTLRNVLLRPLTRLEVVAGKALAGAALVLGAYLALLAVTLTASAAAFGFGDLVEILPNGAHFPLVAAAELRMDLLRALAAPVVALLAFFTLGVACGALARGPASALGLALGVVLGLDLARAAARGLGAEEWLLTAYLPTPLGDTSYLHHFADRAQGISNSLFELDRAFAGIPQDLALPLLWAALAFALASSLFSRRDVP